MTVVVLVAALLATTAALAAAGRRRGVAAFFTDPVLVALSFFAVIHLGMPLLQHCTDFFRYRPWYPEDLYLTSLALVVISHLAYTIALFVTSRRVRPAVQEASAFRFTDAASRKFALLTGAFFLVGFVCSAANAVAILERGLDDYLRDRIGHGVGAAFKLFPIHWTYVACILFYVGRRFSRSCHPRTRLLHSALFAVSGAWAVAYYSLASSRHSIFLLAINLAALRAALAASSARPGSLGRRAARLGAAAALVLLLASLFSFTRELRRSGVEGDPWHNISSRGFAHTLAADLNSAFGNHENVVWLLDHEFTLQLGSTFVAAVTNVVPRSVWPDKPLGGGPILKNTIQPGSYVVGEEGNSSLTTGLYTELLLNFGAWGTLLVSPVAGAVTGLLLSAFCGSRNALVRTFCVFLTVSAAGSLLYAEALGFAARLATCSIPFVVIGAALRSELNMAGSTSDSGLPHGHRVGAEEPS